MLNTIFIVWLFQIEGAGNLHLPVAKINLYYGDKGEKGGIVRTTLMETVFIMSTMILLNILIAYLLCNYFEAKVQATYLPYSERWSPNKKPLWNY